MSQGKIKLFICWAALGTMGMQAHAISEGLYLGLMGGYATNSGAKQMAFVTLDNNGTVSVPVSPKSNQGAIRLYLGYKFSSWFGAEMGGTYYSVINYDKGNVNTNTNVQAGAATVDFVGVAALPIRELFEIYGKAGIAVVYQGQSRSLVPAVPNATSNNRYQTSAKPTFTIGVGYQASQSFLVDLSWTHVNTGGYVKSLDFYALGFSYHIVNVYCGQFLCDDY